MLETTQHQNTEWATLTYAPQFLPTGGTLVPAHISRFIKLLRTRLTRTYGQTGLRFFAVGEYGSRTNRPHYHVFLFGLAKCDRVHVEQLWRYGHVYWAHDPLNTKIAEYTAGYTVKKEGKDAEKLGGRCPEFSRMSLRPPIGAAWAENFGESLADNQYFVEQLATTGFPSSVRFGGKMVPLGRTLARYLRKGLGYFEPSESEKRENAWLRSQLFVNDQYQLEREKRRLAGHARAKARQSVFSKKELL